MLRELLGIFRPSDPLRAMADNFGEMLKVTYQMTLTAGEIFFDDDKVEEERARIYRQDTRVNELERTIRRQVVAHLSLQGNTADLPYCLALISLVKDVERIGDYAKNLTEVIDIRSQPLPASRVIDELREVRGGVETAFEAAPHVLGASDQERAIELIQVFRSLAQRADGLPHWIAQEGFDSSTTTALVLGARYYKRIGAHALNVLTSIVMPLHKLDYYDEDEPQCGSAGAAGSR